MRSPHRFLAALFFRKRSVVAGSREQHIQAALDWIRRQELPSGGIRVHSRHRKAYPEVTGYLVPTLIRYGAEDLVERLVRWLVAVQREDGSYGDPDQQIPHHFDTGQALRGLLAAWDRVPGAAAAAERAAAYLVARMIDGGRRGFPEQRGYREQGIPEPIQLYCLGPLHQAARRWGRPEWAAAATRCCQYYVGHRQFLDLDGLTHFVAYQIEALLELGHEDLARPVLETVAGYQREDGSVPATRHAGWVCVPGLAQLAVCWQRIGRPGPAERALGWLEAHQRPSGGFFGSSGRGATYFPRRELPWAAKYYLDAAGPGAPLDRL